MRHEVEGIFGTSIVVVATDEAGRKGFGAGLFKQEENLGRNASVPRIEIRHMPIAALAQRLRELG